MQQSGYNDMRLLQQHMMFKQAQKEIQQFGEPGLVSGKPFSGESQMNMNWVQRGSSPATEGLSNLYGTPVTPARGNISPYSPLQGIYQESINSLTKSSDQAQKTIVSQSSGFSSPFLKDQYASLQEKTTFGQGSVQGLDIELISGQDGGGWSDMQQKSGQSSRVVPLDPLEEKILYNTDDNLWDSGGFSGALNDTVSNSFPSSLQSGSWSALMQSAVAEASGSDALPREEWSGLTFQNTEALTYNNQVSNLVDSGKQPRGWVGNDDLPSIHSFSRNLNNSCRGQTHASSSGISEHVESYVDKSREDLCVNNSAVLTNSDFLVSSQVSSKIGEINQSCVAPQPSIKSMPSSHDVSQNVHFVNRSGSPGQAGTHMHIMLNESAASQSMQATISSTDRLFNQAGIQHASQENGTIPPGNQYPVLEAGSISQPSLMSNTSQQGEFSPNLFNVWRNAPTGQHSSMGVFNNSFLSFPRVQQIPSKLHNDPTKAVLSQGQEASAKHTPEADLSLPDSLLVHHDQSKTEGISAERNFESVGHSLKPQENSHKNSSVVHVAQESDSTKGDPKTDNVPNVQSVAYMMGHKSCEQNSRLNMPLDGGHNITSHLNSLASGGKKMLSFITEAREGQTAKAFPQHSLPQNIIGLGGFCQSQSSSSNVIASHVGHLSAGNFPHNLQMDPYIEQLRIATQCSNPEPSKAPTLVTSGQFKAPHKLSSDIVNESMVVLRTKKRKTMILEQLPWHKEVMQGSDTHQNISVSEQEWARAVNRLFEKVDGEVERIEPIPRSKRRLILTTQLMQQLLRPAPLFILSANATLQCDIVLYFVSRIALGDACSLTYRGRSDLLLPPNEIRMFPEKLETLERAGNKKYYEAVEGLIEKTKKLEDSFLRLDNTASIVDIRVELQEMERVSVINRFARFHSRVQVDSFGNPSFSAMPKPIPQRYVTAIPLPKILPEGVHCLSL